MIYLAGLVWHKGISNKFSSCSLQWLAVSFALKYLLVNIDEFFKHNAGIVSMITLLPNKLIQRRIMLIRMEKLKIVYIVVM